MVMKRTMPLLAAVLTALASPPSLSAQEARDSTAGGGGLPLQAERTISFETTEGTWMNLDVSPDGRTIVFDLLGDIYTVPVAGGQATRLTSGLAMDAHPVFSPDGLRIVYFTDAGGSDDLWIMNADGSDAEALTKERDRTISVPEWAPDGDYILARRNNDLWLYHAAGGSGMELSDEDDANGAYGATFSADGRYVYFAARGGNPYGHEGALGTVTGWQIRRLDRNTGDIAQVTAAPWGAFRPRVSPDGRFLVYGTRQHNTTSLRLRDLQTDEDTELLARIDRDLAERTTVNDILPRYDFTPDGSAVIIAAGGTFQRVDLASRQARPIAFRAQVEAKLGEFVLFEQRLTDDPVDVKNIRYANRSPDGRRLAFSALSRLYVMDANGGTPRVLVDQPYGQFQPVWSPDGRSIAYVTWSDSVGGHLWRVPAAGGAPERLTTVPAFYLHPTWSPDGSRIAMVREQASGFRNVWSRNTGRVVWLDATGGPLTEVVSAPSDNRLTFTQDGERLLYVDSIRSGGFGENSSARTRLMSVRLDGSDRRSVATINAEAYEIVPAPDMRHIAFTVREDVYVAALPRTPEPPAIGERTGPGPVRRISREGGMDAHWENDSTLAWSFADRHYRIDAIAALMAEDSAAVRPDTITVDISVPRAKPSGTVVLRGADLITMRGDEVIPNGTVVVTDNRITFVGPSASAPSPAGAEVIDVSGRTLMPGLVDVHAHLRPPRDVFVQSAWPYLADLAFGVTTTRDVSSSNDGFAYHELVEAGEVIGPRIFTTGRAMTSGNAKIESLEDARAMVRHYKHQGTSVLKQYAQPHRRQRQWVLMAAKEERLNVTNEGIGDHRLNLGMVLDGFSGFEHALPLGDIHGDMTRLIAESQTFYTPTLVVAYGGPTAEWYFYRESDLHDDERLMRFTPHEIVDRRTRRGDWYADDEYHFKAVAREAAEIFDAGGNLGVGGHGEEQGICVHWELWALQMGGLSNHEALHVATLMGAEALGMQRDLGSIETGKLADLIVLDSSPLDDIRNTTDIRYVMKNGELYEAATLTQVWPERKELPVVKYR